MHRRAHASAPAQRHRRLHRHWRGQPAEHGHGAHAPDAVVRDRAVACARLRARSTSCCCYTAAAPSRCSAFRIDRPLARLLVLWRSSQVRRWRQRFHRALRERDARAALICFRGRSAHLHRVAAAEAGMMSADGPSACASASRAPTASAPAGSARHALHRPPLLPPACLAPSRLHCASFVSSTAPLLLWSRVGFSRVLPLPTVAPRFVARRRAVVRVMGFV